MPPDLVRRRVVIHGHVQGVYFRHSLRQQADAQSVAGWAANRADGTVEAVLEGPADAVAQVIRFCETGPRHARVQRVDVSDEPVEGLRSFDIW